MMNQKTVKHSSKKKTLTVEELIVELKKEQERTSFSQSAGKIGTFEWDIINNVSKWTKEFEALYGFRNGKFKGGNLNKWTKLVHPDDRQKVLEETDNALKNGSELNVEFRVIWPSKSVHHLLTRAKIIRDKDGKALRMVGVNIDISERKQIETNLEYLSQASKLLSSSLDYNKTLISIAKLGVPEIADWCSVDMLNKKGEIEQLAVAHINPKMVKWAQEYNKKNPPDTNAAIGVPNVLRTGKSEIYPFITDEMLVASAKNKKELALIRRLKLSSMMIVPLCVNNKAIGTISFTSTESGRYYSTSDLTIAEEVAGRAALAIENARLFTEAKKAISLRDEFISIASHELKTPVTSLKMYTQVIYKQLERRGEEVLLNPLSKMDTQIDRLTLLIGDLLNVSKIQLGKLEFHEEKFNLQEVIKDTIESIQSHSAKHTITLSGTIKKEVWGDKYRIGQVVTNLINNAIKYSPQGNKVLVTVSESKKAVTVTIQDFGIGIDKEHLDKIFDRFYRVTDPNERTFPGLGIGLYISAEIIKRHGGTISVTSSKGKGSKFSFTLPYTKTNPEVL